MNQELRNLLLSMGYEPYMSSMEKVTPFYNIRISEYGNNFSIEITPKSEGYPIHKFYKNLQKDAKRTIIYMESIARKLYTLEQG